MTAWWSAWWSQPWLSCCGWPDAANFTSPQRIPGNAGVRPGTYVATFGQGRPHGRLSPFPPCPFVPRSKRYGPTRAVRASWMPATLCCILGSLRDRERVFHTWAQAMPTPLSSTHAQAIKN